MQTETQTTPTLFYRLPKVREKCGGVSASTIWAWVKAGKFPQPIKLSANITVWEAKEIERFLQTKIAANRHGSDET